MLRRTDEKLTHQRARQAANARRYRRHFNLGQRVLHVTAVPDCALRFLLRRGHLSPGAYTDAEIELALALLIDYEGAEYFSVIDDAGVVYISETPIPVTTSDTLTPSISVVFRWFRPVEARGDA